MTSTTIQNGMGSTGGFPDLNVPENKKDKTWYHQYAMAIRNLAFGRGAEYTYMDICYSEYNSAYVPTDVIAHLQKNEDGSAVAAQWMDFSTLKVKIDELVGELKKKDYDFRVYTVNKEARDRAAQHKMNLYLKSRLKKSRS